MRYLVMIVALLLATAAWGQDTLKLPSPQWIVIRTTWDTLTTSPYHLNNFWKVDTVYRHPREEPCIPVTAIDTLGDAMWTLSVVDRLPDSLFWDHRALPIQDTILSHSPILDPHNSKAFWEWQPKGDIIKYWVAPVAETTTVYVPVSEWRKR